MKKNLLIVNANYYKDISSGLLKSALNIIPKKNKIKIINVPGVFEIPVTISKYLKKFDAFIALGCVIKGQTPHFDFISQASTDAIMKLSINSKCGVCPLITQPSAIKASNFFKYFEIVTGISKTPGTFIIFILLFFDKTFFAFSNNPDDIAL